MSVRTSLLPGEEPQDQEVRWLERVDGNVVEVLVSIHHMTANHRAKLQDRDAQLLGRLRFRVLPFARFAGYLHTHNCIVGGRSVRSN